MRVLLTVLLLALGLLAPVISVWPVFAKNKLRVKQVQVFLTFHNAGKGRVTSLGKRENSQIVAQNRKKGQNNALPFGALIQPFAYKDKKNGKWVNATLPRRRIADTMGPAARRKNYLWIDYYYTGKRSAQMERFNCTWVKIQVIN